MEFETILNAYEKTFTLMLELVEKGLDDESGKNFRRYGRGLCQLPKLKERLLEMWEVSKSETFLRDFRAMGARLAEARAELEYEHKRVAAVIHRVTEQRNALSAELAASRAEQARLFEMLKQAGEEIERLKETVAEIEADLECYREAEDEMVGAEETAEDAKNTSM